MQFRRAFAALAVAMLCVAAASPAAFAQGGGAAAGKNAEEVFKNIQVLKGVPAEQLVPTMQFIAASLGQQCTFCHVEARDKDDKETKQTARKMIQMVMAINKDNFNGRVQVTCNTCHRGAQDPVGVPVISDAGPAAEAPRAAGGAEQRPTADQLFDKYLQAVGGADALAKVSSRVGKGAITGPDGKSTPIDVYAKGSDAHVMVTHTANGDRSTGYNGTTGWTVNNAGAPRDMAAMDLDGAKLEDDLYLAAHAKQTYTQWRVGRSDKVGDRDAYVLNGTAAGHQPVRLYLDQQSGLLLRAMHFVETQVGRLPAQVDFADYRELNGVKVPYRIILGRTNGRSTIQFDQVQQNGAVDDSKLSKPVAPAP
jgi:photosynthetic reaction center cytochrome c subunit